MPVPNTDTQEPIQQKAKNLASVTNDTTTQDVEEGGKVDLGLAIGLPIGILVIVAVVVVVILKVKKKACFAPKANRPPSNNRSGINNAAATTMTGTNNVKVNYPSQMNVVVNDAEMGKSMP